MPQYDREYFSRPTVEYEYERIGLLRPDQYAAILYTFGCEHYEVRRRPRQVISVGCGLGRLEHELSRLNLEVCGIDVANNRKFFDFDFVLGNLDHIRFREFDTVIFCESIEHIEAEEFERNWPHIVATLRRNQGRFIVTNWENYHPITPSSWDHVRLVDDRFYDQLAEHGNTVYRKGSHLVLEFQ